MRIFNTKLIEDNIAENSALKKELLSWVDQLSNNNYESLDQLKVHFKKLFDISEKIIFFSFNKNTFYLACKINFEAQKIIVVTANTKKNDSPIKNSFSVKKIKDIDFIKSNETYIEYVSRVNFLFEITDTNELYKELIFLELMIEDFQSKTYDFDKPHPIDSIIYMMENIGIDQTKLSLLMQSKSRVSEILKKRRVMSVSNMRKLHSLLGVPMSTLMQEYKIVKFGN